MNNTNTQNDLDGRREVASRNTKWASKIAQKLVEWNLTPNSISILSIVFSIIGGVILLLLPHFPDWYYTIFIAYIFCIQIRLLCNLFDGMVAIEGGKKSYNGDLYNDIPDRISDVFLIVPVGYIVGGYGVELGWLAAVLAVLTAYLRWIGAFKTEKHFFQGPMAKQHRMALLTIMAIVALIFKSYLEYVVYITLIVMNIGLIITSVRRLYLMSRPMSEK